MWAVMGMAAGVYWMQQGENRAQLRTWMDRARRTPVMSGAVDTMAKVSRAVSDGRLIRR